MQLQYLNFACSCLVTKSCLTLQTLWTVTHQAPLSIAFLRKEYWSVLSFSSPVDIHNPGIKPVSPALTGRFFTTELPVKHLLYLIVHNFSIITMGIC